MSKKEDVEIEEVTEKEDVVKETTEKAKQVASAEEKTNDSTENVDKNEESTDENQEKSKTETKTVKLKVLIPFRDKETNEHYKINQEITVSKDRAKELLADKRKLVTK